MAKVTIAQLDADETRPWATARFVRRLVAERRVAFFKLGGKILLDTEDIDALVEAGRVDPARSVVFVRRRRTA